MPIDIVDVSSHDADVVVKTLNNVWGRERPVRISGEGSRFFCELRMSSSDAISSDRVRLTISGDGWVAPASFFASLAVLDGRVDRFESAKERHRLGQGDVAMFPQSAPLDYEYSNSHVVTLRMPSDVIDRVARERLDTREPVRFQGLLAASSAAATQWRRLSNFVHRELSDPDSAFGQPIVNAQLADLVATTALAVFPNDAVNADYRPGPGRVGSASLRRAVEYIHAHACEPVTLTDIANAAGTTGRAIQIAFAKQHGIAPMSYLRQIRLAGAHRDLEDGDPTRGDTVAAIALRWGFRPGGDFSRAYRERYGVPPSHTLRA